MPVRYATVLVIYCTLHGCHLKGLFFMNSDCIILDGLFKQVVSMVEVK